MTQRALKSPTPLFFLLHARICLYYCSHSIPKQWKIIAVSETTKKNYAHFQEHNLKKNKISFHYFNGIKHD